VFLVLFIYLETIYYQLEVDVDAICEPLCDVLFIGDNLLCVLVSGVIWGLGWILQDL
jgi:hypothetical protein